MNYIEAKMLIPITDLYTAYLRFAAVEPLHTNSPMTRAQAITIITASQTMAVMMSAGGTIAYNIFDYTLSALHNTVFEGPGEAAFDPLLAVWVNNSVEIMKTRNQA